ncbi:MAG: glycosyltransferase [Kiritimatiellae bacterium]|nr:glycosyltransferase [Kiritimatiellia bacterium]
MSFSSILMIIYAIGAAIQVGTALFAVSYTRGWIRKKIVSVYDPSFQPNCAVIIPTKGLASHSVKNFRAFLEQNYPSFSVYFVVESESDAGVPTLRELTEEYSHALLVVAGLSTSCSQKIYNMLAGVKVAGNVDVLAFGDNDICPPTCWLRNLIKPLAYSDITVSSGYRWLVNRQSSWGEYVHILMNMTFYAYFTIASYLGCSFLWAGSFAIRRKDFIALEVSKTWNKAISDDVSLGLLLSRTRCKTYQTPEVFIHSDDTFSTARESTLWFQRQILNVKLHHYLIWSIWGFILLVVMPLPFILLPLAIACMLSGAVSFYEAGGIAGCTFFVGELITGMLYGSISPTRRHGCLAACMPFLRIPQIIAYCKTIGVYHINWAGVCYCFDRKGHVASIERDFPSGE